MDWLNYHHLLYFWTVAREGSIARACGTLQLAQPTVSAQIRTLERAIGQRLFEKTGRQLRLSEFGRIVFRYAEEIFSVGRQLEDVIRGRPVGQPLRFTVGVTDSLPKLVIHHLLGPALALPEPLQLICQEGNLEQLLAQLALHELDLILADGPAPTTVKVKAFSHLLGDCGIAFMGVPPLAMSFRRRFPRSLNGAPLLLPNANASLRRALDQWFHQQDMRPAIRGEFADSALMKTFGQTGMGLFAVPQVIEAEVTRRYSVRLVGRVAEVRERFYALTVEKRMRHPAVAAIVSQALTAR